MAYYGAVGENENISLEEPIKKIEQSELLNQTWVLWNGTNYSTTFNSPLEYEQHVSELTSRHVSFYGLIKHHIFWLYRETGHIIAINDHILNYIIEPYMRFSVN
jgi:hypothetical protein